MLFIIRSFILFNKHTIHNSRINNNQVSDYDTVTSAALAARLYGKEW